VGIIDGPREFSLCVADLAKLRSRLGARRNNTFFINPRVSALDRASKVAREFYFEFSHGLLIVDGVANINTFGRSSMKAFETP
jgi:hypothetical protein